jgi:hypothetical protein
LLGHALQAVVAANVAMNGELGDHDGLAEEAAA